MESRVMAPFPAWGPVGDRGLLTEGEAKLCCCRQHNAQFGFYSGEAGVVSSGEAFGYSSIWNSEERGLLGMCILKSSAYK